MRRRLYHKSKSRRAVAVVELAVMLPVFVLILLATIEACTMTFLQQTLKIAAHEGARAAVVPGSDPSKVQNTVNAFLSFRNIQGATVTITPSNYPASAYGTLIQVDVSAPCNANSVFAPFFYSGKTLTGTVIMMKET